MHKNAFPVFVCVAAALTLGTGLLKPADDFALTIYREYPSQMCTSGYLAVNDQITAYTLERPWADNQQNLSSIPAGTYPGILRYDHDDHWRIELQNVPGRQNIQIHIGNQPDQSKGCILVGLQLGSDLCSIVAGTSAPAYMALMNAFYGTDNPVSTPDKNISVSVVDAGASNVSLKSAKIGAASKNTTPR